MLQNNFFNFKINSNYINLFYLELKKIKNIFETDGFENNFYLILMLRIKAKYHYRNGINPKISLEFKNFIIENIEFMNENRNLNNFYDFFYRLEEAVKD